MQPTNFEPSAGPLSSHVPTGAIPFLCEDSAPDAHRIPSAAEGICNAPHLSSGREWSPVAKIIVTFKLARGLVS